MNGSSRTRRSRGRWSGGLACLLVLPTLAPGSSEPPRPRAEATVGQGGPGAQRGAQRGAREGARRPPAPTRGQAGPVPPDALPPEVAGAEPPVSLHGEVAGSADQRLLGLAASSAGFAAVWSDARHGTPCAYLRRFQPGGQPAFEERVVRERYAEAGEVDPSLALGAGGHAVVAWQLEDEPLDGPAFHYRRLEPDGDFDLGEEIVHSKQGWVVSLEPDLLRPEEDRLRARVAIDARGQISAAWIHRGFVLLQRPEGRLSRLDPAGPPATGGLRLVSGPEGPRAAAWNTESGVRVAHLRADRAVAADCGPGTLLGLAPDPDGIDRTWLLVEVEGRAVLRATDASGRVEGGDRVLLEGPLGRLELASWSGGLACLRLAPGERGAPGPLELRLFAHPRPSTGPGDGADQPLAPSRAPLVVPSSGPGAGVLDALLAGSGGRLMVAWSERRGSGAQVFGRVLAANSAEPGPEFRLAEARATADQDLPVAASIGGARAAVVWEDRSSGSKALRGRLVGADGELEGEPFDVPRLEDASSPAGPASDPSVAMGPAGDFLVTWTAGSRLVSQAFHPDGAAKRAPVTVARAFEPARGAALTRQESYRSWLAGWNDGAGLRVQRVRGDGELLAKPTAVGGAANAAQPALLELFGERIVVAWEEPGQRGTLLRLRLLEAELQAATEVLEPPLPPLGSHRDPHLARAPEGGFLLAWRVELGAGRARIAAQRFDAEGQSQGAPIPIGAGEGPIRGLALARAQGFTWAFGWELETVFGPRVVVCRLGARAEAAGPERLLDPPTVGYRTGGMQPALAAVEDGLLGFWVDAHRGAGLDVWYRRLPLAFDRD